MTTHIYITYKNFNIIIMWTYFFVLVAHKDEVKQRTNLTIVDTFLGKEVSIIDIVLRNSSCRPML